MSGSHHHHGPLSSADDWDVRYGGAGGERIWSGAPNVPLVAETSGLVPGRALDLGCGEGADAIWLAGRGWQVTGIDISRVALDRAAQTADEAGVAVDWILADFVAQPPARDAYDLVTSHYPALLRTDIDRAVDAVIRGVAPGGTLLFVGHEVSDPSVPREHGFEPDDYVQPDDVAARLDADWSIEVNETRERAPSPSRRPPHRADRILRARRRSASR